MRFALAFLVAAALLASSTGCENRSGPSPEMQRRLDSLQSANQQLQQRVDAMHDSLRLGLERPPGKRGTELEPAIYFPSGSAWLTDRGRRTLDEHAATIKERYDDRNFRIQGYTDSVPIGDSLSDIYPSNWYLSAQRAAAVAHYLYEEHGVRTPTLEIGAYGPQVPVASNETAEGRSRNRRVEIVIDEPAPDPGM
jgi:chemotaxis protein MotB